MITVFNHLHIGIPREQQILHKIKNSRISASLNFTTIVIINLHHCGLHYTFGVIGHHLYSTIYHESRVGSLVT